MTVSILSNVLHMEYFSKYFNLQINELLRVI